MNGICVYIHYIECNIMRAKFSFEADVEDDFSPGYCYGCPISYYESEDFDNTPMCPLGYTHDECKLKMTKVRKKVKNED